MYRVEKYKAYYEAEGFKVQIFPVEANGLDMIVEAEDEENGDWIAGVEIINWNEKGYLNKERLDRMEKNWLDFEMILKTNKDTRDYRRWLIYSYYSNIKNMIRHLFAIGVELIEVGYQDLPKDNVDGWIS